MMEEEAERKIKIIVRKSFVPQKTIDVRFHTETETEEEIKM